MSNRISSLKDTLKFKDFSTSLLEIRLRTISVWKTFWLARF